MTVTTATTPADTITAADNINTAATHADTITAAITPADTITAADTSTADTAITAATTPADTIITATTPADTITTAAATTPADTITADTTPADTITAAAAADTITTATITNPADDVTTATTPADTITAAAADTITTGPSFGIYEQDVWPDLRLIVQKHSSSLRTSARKAQLYSCLVIVIYAQLKSSPNQKILLPLPQLCLSRIPPSMALSPPIALFPSIILFFEPISMSRVDRPSRRVYSHLRSLCRIIDMRYFANNEKRITVYNFFTTRALKFTEI